MLKLSNRLEEVLILAYGMGLREVDIARRLNITRQAVSKALKEAKARLTEIFITLADILNADLVRVELSKGYAVLRIRQNNTRAYIIYVPGRGPRIIFKDGLDCSSDNMKLCSEIVDACRKWGLIKDVSEEGLEEVIKNILRRFEE